MLLQLQLRALSKSPRLLLELECLCAVVSRDVSEGVVQKLMQLKQALDQGDFNQASSIQVSHP